MGTRYIYLVRHGQYDPPRERNSPLTKVGVMQAIRTSNTLRHLPFSTLITSTMPRAERTARVMNAYGLQGVPFQTSDLLREVVLPSYAGVHAGVEAYEESEQQADEAYTTFLQPTEETTYDLLVTHGNLIRTIVCRVLGVEHALWTNMDSLNCAITRIRIPPDGIPRLLTYNDVAHLPRDMHTDNLHTHDSPL